MREKWVELKGYDGYLISTEGRVMREWSERIKEPSVNQQGVCVVNLVVDKRQYLRSLAVLVANTFLYNLETPKHFNTPIHLNGDRMDCRVDNLMLRPRWFAIKYHQQFSEWERENRPGFTCPVLLVETEEVFPTSWDAAIKYGLIDRDIWISSINATYVFPQGFHFEPLEEEHDQPYINAQSNRGL